MDYFDLHCDTLSKAFFKGSDEIGITDTMVDIARMETGGALAQIFAIFMPQPDIAKYLHLDAPPEDSEYIDGCFQIFRRTMERSANKIAPAYSAGDILENKKHNLMSGLLSFEDGRPVDGDLNKLKVFYERGIRLITLTWNHANCFGYPCSTDQAVMQKGLSDFGKEAVEYMNELGIAVDVSHLSDGGFEDVAKISRRPFLASHSNCRELSPHQRNLTDAMIRRIAQKGGVVGVNFCPGFLNADTSSKTSTIALIMKHIRHLVQTGGIDCVSLGGDLDGIDGELEISGADKMPLLFDALHNEGFSFPQIEKIAWKNALRFFGDVL